MGLEGGLINFDKVCYEQFTVCHAENEKKRCPICGSLETKRKGFSRRTLRTSRGKISTKIQRYYCHHCKHSFTAQGFNRRRHFSKDYIKKVVLDYVLTKSSLSETGLRYSVSRSSILNWMRIISKEYPEINDLPMYQPCSGYIQFDGKFPAINGKKFCLIHSSDAHSNEPVCFSLYENENTESTNKFLHLLKSKYPATIKGAISDFGKGRCFIKPVKEIFPNALHQICIVHYLRYLNLFLPRTRKSQYFLRNRVMKALIRNMLHSPDRSESEFWLLTFQHFIPFFKADYHRRFIRSINKHYHRLTAFYEDDNLRSDTNAIENRNRQLERKLKNMDGFGSIENAKSFLRIWFYYEKKKFDR